MIIRASDGIRGVLIDLLTSTMIRKVKWADLDTGEYEALKYTADGEIVRDDRGVPITYRGKTRLRFIPDKPLKQPAPTPINVEEDKERVIKLQEAKPHLKHVMQLKLPALLFNCKCDHKGCNSYAQWMTADELDLAPQQHNGRYYTRAKTITRHYWCSRHYQHPKLYDAKGELMSTQTENVVQP